MDIKELAAKLRNKHEWMSRPDSNYKERVCLLDDFIPLFDIN